ncbi:hypothetical protein [Porphyrobacter sp. ULC335]|uniref:hypothetical protein n=1 Tax=Porphyrobacter sp. ULC335 TaxID=2854260 RepID=UPI00221F55C1|nr:hypothetical protein [Porphyrobacter sp. ULC335]UYV15272.1 hypothetical protein KVF90_14270 [Porphyrobacter sp. ULC335]
MISSIFVLFMQPAVSTTEPEAAAVEAVAETPAAEVAVQPEGLLLPRTTPLIIAIDKELGSKISQTGETFPIRLAQAVSVEGVEVLPAGITGQGEVVHAKKAGLAGAAGELVLAARYLDLNGRRIELRSFRFMEAGETSLGKGQDNTGVSSMTTAIAGPIGFFIGGGNTNVMPGTIANAKTRNDELFERPAPAEAVPAESAEPQVENREELP